MPACCLWSLLLALRCVSLLFSCGSFQKEDYSAVEVGNKRSLIRPATMIPTTTAPAVHNIPLTFEFICYELNG